jgi:DNA-binding response OmpR family regulator
VNRILIVEDEIRITSFLEKGLKANGFDTAVATEARTALNMVRLEDYDLVILDLNLPNLEGLEVLHELREVDEELPVIILTEREGVAKTARGLEWEANDYITKPFRFKELLTRVRTRLRRPSPE